MTVCLYILPRLLKKYRTLYPGVDLQVTAGSSEKILQRVRAHEVDLGLLTLPVVAKDMEVVPVLKEEMVVVTAPGHPLSRERTIDPASLGKYPLILYEAGSNTRKVLDQFFLEEAISAEVAMETENVEIIKAMVAINLGVTIVPYTPVAKDVRSGRLGLVAHTGAPPLPRHGLGLPQDRAPAARGHGAAARLRRDEGPAAHAAGGRVGGQMTCGRRSGGERAASRHAVGLGLAGQAESSFCRNPPSRASETLLGLHRSLRLRAAGGAVPAPRPTTNAS